MTRTNTLADACIKERIDVKNKMNNNHNHVTEIIIHLKESSIKNRYLQNLIKLSRYKFGG